jgi:hypothetical protein
LSPKIITEGRSAQSRSRETRTSTRGTDQHGDSARGKIETGGTRPASGYYDLRAKGILSQVEAESLTIADLIKMAATYALLAVPEALQFSLVKIGPGANFVPYLCVPGAESAFALFSASKGWNLAGLKAAALVAGPDAADDLARLPEEVSHGPSHLGILAHTVALERGPDLAHFRRFWW